MLADSYPPGTRIVTCALEIEDGQPHILYIGEPHPEDASLVLAEAKLLDNPPSGRSGMLGVLLTYVAARKANRNNI